jgi:hypothetical protein
MELLSCGLMSGLEGWGSHVDLTVDSEFEVKPRLDETEEWDLSSRE